MTYGRSSLAGAAVALTAALATACSDGAGTAGPSPSTPSAVATSPTPTESEPTPVEATYTPSDIERDALATLTKAGVDGDVVEHGFKEAWVGGPWRGRDVTVHVYPGTRPAPGSAAGRSTVDGVAVEYFRTDAMGVVARFTCGAYTYVVAVPSGAGTRAGADAFLPTYVPAACA